MTRTRKGPADSRPAKPSESTPEDSRSKLDEESILPFQREFSAHEKKILRLGLKRYKPPSGPSYLQQMHSRLEESAADLVRLGTERQQILTEIQSLTALVKGQVVDKNSPSRNASDPKLKSFGLRRVQRRGPPANMDLHRTIFQIVKPYGSDWKDLSNLEQIAKKLDRTKRTLTPPSRLWANRRPPVRSWKSAVLHYPELVIKKIMFSLEMADRNPQ
jgi:hypothetical protein